MPFHAKIAEFLALLSLYISLAIAVIIDTLSVFTPTRIRVACVDNYSWLNSIIDICGYQYNYFQVFVRLLLSTNYRLLLQTAATCHNETFP